VHGRADHVGDPGDAGPDQNDVARDEIVPVFAPSLVEHAEGRNGHRRTGQRELRIRVVAKVREQSEGHLFHARPDAVRHGNEAGPVRRLLTSGSMCESLLEGREGPPLNGHRWTESLRLRVSRTDVAVHAGRTSRILRALAIGAIRGECRCHRRRIPGEDEGVAAAATGPAYEREPPVRLRYRARRCIDRRDSPAIAVKITGMSVTARIGWSSALGSSAAAVPSIGKGSPGGGVAGAAAAMPSRASRCRCG